VTAAEDPLGTVVLARYTLWKVIPTLALFAAVVAVAFVAPVLVLLKGDQPTRQVIAAVSTMALWPLLAWAAWLMANLVRHLVSSLVAAKAEEGLLWLMGTRSPVPLGEIKTLRFYIVAFLGGEFSSIEIGKETGPPLYVGTIGIGESAAELMDRLRALAPDARLEPPKRVFIWPGQT
jgi:hypothetical protein